MHNLEAMPDLEPWRTLRRELLLDRSPWMRVFADDVELPDGRVVEGYLHLETPQFVIIVPVDESGRMGFVRSYRRGVDGIDVQPPAGVMDPGETPLEAARRELVEEMGCQADDWRELGTFAVDGNRGGGPAHLFLATGCRHYVDPDSGDLEEQQVLWLPPDEVRRMWLEGGFRQLASVAAVGLAFAELER